MKKIYETFDSTEAEMIKSRLETANIPCLLKGDDASGALPHLSAQHGFELFVTEEDEELALKILAD